MDLRHLLNDSPEPEPSLLLPNSDDLAVLWNWLKPPATHEPRLPLPSPPNNPLPHPLATSIERNVTITKKTTVSELYRYPPGVSVEYPESSESGVGHLFRLDPDGWTNPTLDFLYSKGEPRGYSKKGEDVSVPILTDSEGQGVKIYPNVDLAIVSQPHTHTTREALRQTLASDGEIQNGRLDSRSSKRGLSTPRQEETLFDSDEEEAQEARQEYQAKNRWGYVPKVLTCDGRLQFSHSFDGQPIIKCEHYSRTSNKDHYFNASIGDGSYDTIYLVAIFDGDEEVSV
ncbi:hypothetical protein B0H14DRAFT_2641083 [Mycena olivaceomarginata]|nr:hypothetical protein B0H14DRAFT_2641083 [Mycena olivaceomarginata]